MSSKNIDFKCRSLTKPPEVVRIGQDSMDSERSVGHGFDDGTFAGGGPLGGGAPGVPGEPGVLLRCDLAGRHTHTGRQ